MHEHVIIQNEAATRTGGRDRCCHIATEVHMSTAPIASVGREYLQDTLLTLGVLKRAGAVRRSKVAAHRAERLA